MMLERNQIADKVIFVNNVLKHHAPDGADRQLATGNLSDLLAYIGALEGFVDEVHQREGKAKGWDRVEAIGRQHEIDRARRGL
jgi:hypothetical protein